MCSIFFIFSSQFGGSSRVEIAHQEAVALRRQEELIREEEAAVLAENGKRDKRSKKKQVQFSLSAFICFLKLQRRPESRMLNVILSYKYSAKFAENAHALDSNFEGILSLFL
jgi:hypothetical protein